MSEAVLILHGTGAQSPPELPQPALVIPRLVPTVMQSAGGLARGHNLLVVTVDAMRADRMPPMGKSVGMENIERLAEKSVLFARAYAPACATMHSMAGFFKSRFLTQMIFSYVALDRNFDVVVVGATEGHFKNPLVKQGLPAPVHDPSPSLALVLRDEGYETATIPSWALYLPGSGMTRDFEVVRDEPLRKVLADWFAKHSTSQWAALDVDITKEALRYLDKRETSRPFFLWLHYVQPHAPYTARDDAAKGADAVGRYESELRFVDREFGRVLGKLEVLGLRDHTVVLVHADHGEEFGDHGGQFHFTTVYEEQVHVPLIIHVPGQHAHVVHDVVSGLDVVPTLLDLLGLRSDLAWMGRSLVPLLEGGRMAPRPVVTECFGHGFKKRAVVSWPHKLIVDEELRTLQLFDLRADPKESRGLRDERLVAELIPWLDTPRLDPP